MSISTGPGPGPVGPAPPAAGARLFCTQVELHGLRRCCKRRVAAALASPLTLPAKASSQEVTKETLKMEEEKFLILLDRGIKILNDEISKIDKELPGDVAFKLYDTYGFPLDLTEDILRNKSLSIDTKKFLAPKKILIIR